MPRFRARTHPHTAQGDPPEALLGRARRVIHWPEAAILGVARAGTQPTLADGTASPGTFLPLCPSYDHRLIDAAPFLRWLANALEHGLHSGGTLVRSIRRG